MNRKYDTRRYRQVVEDLRQYFVKPAITTDVITGFPGETAEEFEETYAFIESIGFSRLHVFPYSRRQGTAAAAMARQVSNAIKAGRSHKLMELGRRMEREYILSLVGAPARLVPERARQLCNNMSADIAPIMEKTSRLSESRKPAVLMIITHGPQMYVADRGNYMDSLITIGGGRNIATGAVMTKDEVLAADPDIIIVPLTDWTQATYDGLRNGSEPWMQGLKAVKQGRVYAVDYDAVGRPGPALGEGAMQMAKALHPEMFP
jgi:hypothetical protein